MTRDQFAVYLEYRKDGYDVAQAHQIALYVDVPDVFAGANAFGVIRPTEDSPEVGVRLP